MNRPFLLAVAVAAFFSISSCSPPLPKAYGIYAREGRSLVDLTDKEDSADWGLAGDVAIVVFEREIAEQGFIPNRDLTLHRTAYVRSEQIFELRVDARSAQGLLNRGPGNVPAAELADLPVRRRSAQKGTWITIGSPISVRYEPVEDRRDILVVIPDAPLPSGTYVLTRLSAEGTRQVAFAVDLSADLQSRQKANCVDEHLYTVQRPKGFQGWDQWFTDINSMEKERSRRSAAGNPVLAVSTEPCSTLDEVAKDLQVPAHIQGAEASVLRSWLSYNPAFRLAEAKDCDCDQDLSSIRQSWTNPHPYYVQADFNADGNKDFAVVLLDLQADHQWGWNAALAVFNGPLSEGIPPAFFEEQIGSPQGSLLYHSSEVPLLIGPWESEGSLLAAKGNTYALE